MRPSHAGRESRYMGGRGTVVAPRSRIGAGGIAPRSVGSLPRTSTPGAQADHVSLMLSRGAPPARTYGRSSRDEMHPAGFSRFIAEQRASASDLSTLGGSLGRDSPRSPYTASGSSSTSTGSSITALSSTLPAPAGTTRVYGSSALPSSSLSAAGRLHSALLPDRSADWKPVSLSSARADRLSQSSTGSERRTVMPYGCTVVDGATLSAPTLSSSARATSGSLKCDKCDGPHATASCPHYKKGRDNHPDALIRKATGMGGEESDGSVVVLTGARVRHQPGDGNCLFHSLAYGLGGGLTASALRRELTSFIERNSELEIAGTPLSQWVKWDSGTSVSAYARRMSSSGCWGGGIELAAVSKMKAVNVSVFEPAQSHAPGTFKRIGQFVYPASQQTVHVLYRGGVHYDALEGGSLKTIVPPTTSRR